MRLSLLALLFGSILSVSAAEPEILASGELAADAVDAKGDTIGGIGSGIVYDAERDVYLMISDRGPGDGSLPYRPRVGVLKIPQEGRTLVPKMLRTIILKDQNGRAMTGLIPDDPNASLPRMKDGRTCIDPEAIALAQNDHLFITDEYGPFLYEFDTDGTMIRRYELPAEFQPREADGTLNYTDQARLVSGRAINQGPEGMCLLPGEKQAALIFQSASVEDGGKASGTTKIVVLDLTTSRPSAIYRYVFSPEVAGGSAKKLSVNDLVALDDRRFLVLERDGLGRDGGKNDPVAKYKSVWLADVSQATNLLDAKTGASITPVRKELLFNLAQLVQDPRHLAAKWEGITLLPDSDKNAITLMMTADNDFLAPTIREDGTEYHFPRAKDSVPTQFYKIRAPLPRSGE